MYQVKRNYQPNIVTKIPTDAYTNIQKEITSTENKLINLYNKQERFLETGGKEGTSTYKRMSYDIGELERKLQMAQADMQNLVNTVQHFLILKIPSIIPVRLS